MNRHSVRRVLRILDPALLCTLFLTILFGLYAVSNGSANAAGPAAAVKITNFKFEPKVLTIKAGTTVTWTVESGTHTVISDGKTFTSANLAQGKTFSQQFSQPGKYPYYCSFHGDKGGKDMSGTIIVTK